jgi:protein tyrosine/serine phosphatase
MYVPPDAFGIVEKGVYRSNSLQPVNFEFVRTLHLKTIVILSPEAPTRALTVFAEENNIEVADMGLKGWKPGVDWRPVSEELVKEGLELILNLERLPVMVTCTAGIHQTGILIGCLRKLQHWNFNSIIDEVSTDIFLFHLSSWLPA